MSVTQEQIQETFDDFLAHLEQKVNKHGDHPYASPHEILGLLTEEVHELVEAIRLNDVDQTYSELADVAVVCLWGMATLKGNKDE